MFNVGDLIECFNPDRQTRLAKGHIYTIESRDTAGLLRLVGMDGLWNPDRFRLVPGPAPAIPPDTDKTLGLRPEELGTSVGKKNDKDLPPLVQGCLSYFPRALLAVANVSKFGASKYSVPYSDQNWRKVEGGYARYTDALGRHILKESVEGLYDQESKLLHASHAAWDALARLELLLTEGQTERDAT